MTDQFPEPLSLERARLLLGWLRSQRAVDNCLSELLAAGPAGERRVSREIDRVSKLVAAAGAAFDAYRECVTQAAELATGDGPRPVLATLQSVNLGSTSPLTR